MITDSRDPAVIKDERRHGPRRAALGRRLEDEGSGVGVPEILALVRAIEKRIDDEREERRRLADELRSTRTTVVRWSGAVVMVIFVLSWVGPTRLVGLIKAVAGGGP